MRRSQRFSSDRTLFLLTLALVVLGTLAVADASAPQAQTFFGDSWYFVKQQAIWAVVGVIAMIVVSRIDYRVWKSWAVPLFWVSLIALVLVLIPGIGSKALGARRWISVGPIGFQPSELVKLSVAVYFARLAEVDKNIKTYGLLLVAIAGLVMLQPDLGTTLIIAGIGFIQIFISGVPIASILGMVGAGAVGAIVLILSSTYRRERLMTFLVGHEAGAQGTGYHISQVLIALGSGGLFGVGLGQGRQKYLFLPESATDSVFAVLAEEIGFIGSIALIAIFIFLLMRGLRIAKNAPDRFGTMLATGIVAWLATQFFLNLSSMLSITPLTGVPLPFFSYGGSSLTMILVGIGILLSISRHAKE